MFHAVKSFISNGHVRNLFRRTGWSTTMDSRRLLAGNTSTWYRQADKISLCERFFFFFTFFLISFYYTYDKRSFWISRFPVLPCKSVRVRILLRISYTHICMTGYTTLLKTFEYVRTYKRFYVYVRTAIRRSYVQGKSKKEKFVFIYH